MSEFFQRLLSLPPPETETFFLWGPRLTGKSTLLNSTYPGAFKVDLLLPEEYRRYLERPQLLVDQVRLHKHRFIVIDEIQKVPDLLDAVHWLHENEGVRFALCGSSARKVRKGHANLLGGRGLTYELHGLSAREIGSAFDLERMLNHGYLPRIYESEQPQRLLAAYVGDYLKEEVFGEGLVRNLPVFSEFLNVAALSDGDLVNFSNIARDCGVSSHTVKEHFQILADTLLGRWLPAYTKRPKRRVIASPKFYFADVGVVNFLARRGRLEARSELFGKAFENWVFHELTAWNAYHAGFATLSYWRLTSGMEVDFVVNDLEVAIEAKATARVDSDDLKALRALVEDHPRVRQRIVVCLEPRPRRTDDGILVLPYRDFCARLEAEKLF